MDVFNLDQAPKALRSRLRRRALPTGAMLFRRGDPALAVYVIEHGRVAMIRHSSDGRRVTLLTAGSGESFAEGALFSDAYHCDAVAEVPTRVVVIPKLELRNLLARQQRLTDQLMARLAHQIQDLRSRLELRNIRSARERVWQALLLAAGESGTTVTFDRPLKVIAGEVGLTHEAFYRALSKLSQAGRIRRRGRCIDLMA
jgi:CRP-like cAMP-binding protein